jgi:hypothetical protein
LKILLGFFKIKKGGIKMDAKTQDMVAKILKLLELGDADKNSNPHEREMAQKKAAQLMAEYSLSFVDLREGKPRADSFTRIDIDGSEEKMVHWEGTLAHCIGRVFDCRVISLGGNRSYDPWKLAFLGAKTDIEIAIFFFKYLRRTVGVMSESISDRVKVQDSYAMGMVTTIDTRLEELFKKRDEFIPSDCKALVIQKKDDVNKFTESQFKHLRPIRHETIHDHNYEKGRADGQRVNLSRPIGNDANKAAGYVT